MVESHRYLNRPLGYFEVPKHLIMMTNQQSNSAQQSHVLSYYIHVCSH